MIVEGFRLLPHLVRPLLATHRQAVWLLPTPEFRQAALQRRGSAWTIAGKTSDPERAQRNLLERDRLFTEHLEAEARRLELRVIPVHTTMPEDELLARVTEALAL